MARFLSESGLLFQHIPRTGGTWIKRVVERCGIKQMHWLNVQPPWLPNKHSLITHYRFAKMRRVKLIASFVRHPTAYYESVWKWMDRGMKRRGRREGVILGKRLAWHPRINSVRWYQPDFNDWVFLMLQKEPMWYTRLIEQYVGPDGGEFCDFIGRTETLAEDVRGILGAVGCGEQVRKHWDRVETDRKWNASGNRLFWDEGLRKDVLETERLMTDRFYGENFARRIYAGRYQKAIAAMVGRRTGRALGILPRRSW